MIWSKSTKFKQWENQNIFFFSAMAVVYLLNFAWHKAFGKEETNKTGLPDEITLKKWAVAIYNCVLLSLPLFLQL